MKIESIRFFQSDNLLVWLGGFLEFQSTIDALNKKKYRVQNTGATYRVINHWAEKGLFDEGETTEKDAWRSFSIKDLVFIRLYQKLRGYGFSLDTIKKVRTSLTEKNSNPYPAIEFCIGMLTQGQPVFLVVFDDGYADVALTDCISQSDSLLGCPTYLRINAYELILELYPNMKPPKYEPLTAVAASGLSVLDAMEENLTELKVTFSNGKPSLIHKKRTLEQGQTAADINCSLQYGNISTTKRNGKTVATEVTVQEKL